VYVALLFGLATGQHKCEHPPLFTEHGLFPVERKSF
jgi:hypothetical protein